MKKYLQYIGFFNGFSEDELDAFSDVSDVLTTKDQEFILTEDDDGKGLYFIFNGEFQAIKRIDDKKNKILSKLKRGEFFGEMSLLNDENNSASVISNGEGALIFISKEAYFKLSESNPKVSLKIMKKLASILSDRLRHMNQKYGMAIGQIYTG